MAGLGEIIDGVIAPLAPGWAAERAAARARLEANLIGASQVRQYDVAGRGRRTSGWRRDATSADAEGARGRSMASWAAHDLVRNNPNAAAGVRHLVAAVWGDGIAPQFLHPVKRIQQMAQDDWDRFAESKVDGFGDWYGHGKVACREMMVGGESLTMWLPDDAGLNASVIGMEGAYLDMAKTMLLSGGAKIVQGVQFAANGTREGYWLFDHHPNDIAVSGSMMSRMIDAQYVDHMYERLRFGQTRGVSWLAPVAMTLRDIADIADAKRLQEKVQACLAMIIQPGEGQASSPLGEQKSLEGDDGAKPLGETIRPGMIARVKPGETINVVNPQPSANTVDFMRHQLAGVSANMAPYHLMTGDVSGASYTTLRAAMNGLYAKTDDWQQNEVIPLLCRPAAQRRMHRLALIKGDPRFLEVRQNWALPVRRMVDPIKDLAGEVMEIRAGLKLLSKALAERGVNADEHLQAISEMNKTIDRLSLALDSDPRRLTDAGILQAAAGYLKPQADGTG